jgi:lysyl-tRNA synthetase class 2
LPNEEDIVSQRLERIQDIEALGFQAYGHRFDSTHTIPELAEKYESATAEELEANPVAVRICGRVKTVRRMGKAGFAHLQQGGELFQIYVRRDGVPENDFTLYKKLLDIGDIIGAEGKLFRTKTNHLSLMVEKLYFLSKTLLNMPEKWHGLEDVETRYRQRYLDLIANPEVLRLFVVRAKIVSSLRRQLEERGFIEVETPMMQSVYGGATARPFVTHHNTLDLDLYLRIAPELYLKRLVVGGMERVYEINRNFRNEGISTQHNPEFTMLEFYQAYADYEVLMDVSGELLRQTAIDATGSAQVVYQGTTLDFDNIRRLSVREAVIGYWKDGSPPTMDQVRDPNWLSQHSTKATPGEALVEIFEEVVEEQLIQPTIICDYPIETSPLSKNKPDEPEFVERFEIYAAGMEIANAYTELNDPQEQRRRFEMQLAMKERGDEEAHQMDEDYLRAMCYGLSPTGGEGIGIDRLTMLLTDSKSIRDVILFPLLRPEPEIGLAKRLHDLDQ